MLRRALSKRSGNARQKRSQNAELRIQEITRRAAELFDRSGYANASMEDLAAAVGLAKPSLYHYVKSKDEVLFLIHRQFMDAAFAALDARMREVGDTRTQLRGVITDLVELVCSQRPLVRVFFEHFRDLPAARRRNIVMERDRYMRTVVRVIRRGVQRAELVRGLDPTLAALAIFGACNWTYQWYDPRGRLPPRAIGTVFADFLLEGMTPGRDSVRPRDLRNKARAPVP
jgi:AcrR family transcriptional regulator